MPNDAEDQFELSPLSSDETTSPDASDEPGAEVDPGAGTVSGAKAESGAPVETEAMGEPGAKAEARTTIPPAAQSSPPKRTLWVCTGLGLGLGLVIAELFSLFVLQDGPLRPMLFFLVMMPLASWVLLLEFGWDAGDNRRLALFAAIFAFVFSLAAMSSWLFASVVSPLGISGPDLFAPPKNLFFISLALTAAGLPLLLERPGPEVAPRVGRFALFVERFPSRLVESVVTFCVAALLAVLSAYLILALCLVVFLILSPDAADRRIDAMLDSYGFLFGSISAAFGFWVGMLRTRWRGLARWLTWLVHRLSRVLLPVATVLTGLLLVLSMAELGLGGVLNQALLLGSLIALVLLTNGVMLRQDTPRGAWDRRFLLLASALQPLTALFLFTGILKEYVRSGLSPDMGWTFLATMLLGDMGLAYTVFLFFGSRQSDAGASSFGKVTVWGAAAFLALALTFQNPFANPVSFAAMDQYERLLSGRTPLQEFDFHAMVRDYGQHGRNCMKDLYKRASSNDLPQPLRDQGDAIVRTLIKTDPQLITAVKK